MTISESDDLALSGIRILELGHTVMGPSCSMVLADLGADVIKVEPPEGDRTRANVGFGSALFPVFNRNKRSLCIDLKSEAGKKVFEKALTGKAPPPMPEKASSWAVYDPFKTADGKTVFVGITSDNHWRSFCKGFGVEELLGHADLKSNPQRAQQRAKIMPIVTEKFGAETSDSLCAKLEQLNIPFGPLATPGDLFEDRHLNESGRMLDLLLPTGKRAKIPGLPLDMDGRKTRIRRQPPEMGEHTRAVLEEAGFAGEEIQEFVSQGTVIAK